MYTDIEQQTAEIVDRQLEAYNARDIEAFAATYHNDIEIHSFSKGLVYKGKSTLVERYGKVFEKLAYLNARSLTRMVQGQTLVDHELAQSSSTSKDDIERSVKVIAAYQVEDGLITKVTFS